MPAGWLAGIRWDVLDLSGPYGAAYAAAVPTLRAVYDIPDAEVGAGLALWGARRCQFGLGGLRCGALGLGLGWR